MASFSFQRQHFGVLLNFKLILTSQFSTSPHSYFWVMFSLYKYTDLYLSQIHSGYKGPLTIIIKIFMCISINHVRSDQSLSRVRLFGHLIRTDWSN